VFAAAFAVGVLYCGAFERTKPPPEPWVRELAAAASFACGYGYADPGYAPSPAVAAFLDKKMDSLSCKDFPNGAPLGPPNFTQSLYRYMTMAVGVTWKLFGVSWTRLAVLFGVLYGASALAIYGMFRLATNRAIAAAGALIMTVSALQLRFLPQLRDYAKAPFILTLVFILAVLVVRPFSPRRVLALAAAYGAVMGIGFGFRNDLLINVVPFVVTIALFLPVPLRSQVRTKLAALALCASVFVVAAWPIIRAYQSGSNTGHVAILGLMTSFNGPLGVTSSVYDWGAPYDDGFAMKVVRSYAERVHGRDVTPLSSEYERATLEYLLLVGRHWPADLLTRAYASVLRVVELPFQVRSYTTSAPPAISGGVVGWLYAIWDGVWSRLSGIGAPIAAAAIVAVASVNIRIAVWLLAALLYFAGYPALQFDPRHFFFLEFIPWLALGLLCQAALLVWAARREPTFAARGRPALAFALGAVLVLVGSTVGLRAYQQRHVTKLLDRYLETPTEKLTLTPGQIDDRQLLLRPVEVDRSGAGESDVRADYLIVDVVRRNCERLLAPVTFRYETMTGYTDLSQRVYVPVPRTDEPFRLFFPAYSAPGTSFAGVEVADADRDCIAAVRRVKHLDRTPVLLNLTLPPDWRQMKLYQTLTNWEPPSAPFRVQVYAWPRTLDLGRLHFAPAALPELTSATHSSIVTAEAPDRWVVDGFVRNSTSFLVRLPERSVPRGVSFFARGTLYRGGFTLGVLKNQLWATSVNVTAPGEFFAVVEVPEDGPYVPALANFLMGVNRRNDFVVTSAGWAERKEMASASAAEPKH